MAESISSHPHFTAISSWTMNVLFSGNEEIKSESSQLIGSVISQAVSVPSPMYTNLTVSYIVYSSYTSDINYMTYDQSYLIAKGTTSKITLDLPCSVSGSTLISYNIANYMTSIAPSWVTIDSSTGELKISAPSVTSDTDYKFYVYSSINGFTNSVPKLIKLTILNCVSKN